jgi:hypothetical protein
MTTVLRRWVWLGLSAAAIGFILMLVIVGVALFSMR